MFQIWTSSHCWAEPAPLFFQEKTCLSSLFKSPRYKCSEVKFDRIGAIRVQICWANTASVHLCGSEWAEGFSASQCQGAKLPELNSPHCIYTHRATLEAALDFHPHGADREMLQRGLNKMQNLSSFWQRALSWSSSVPSGLWRRLLIAGERRRRKAKGFIWTSWHWEVGLW